MDFSRSAFASTFLVACGALRPEVVHVTNSVLAQAPEFWKRSDPDLKVACRDPMTCGPKGPYGEATEGRCRDFECSGCSLGKCMTVHEAKMCCEENSDCSAVYGGGSHWWTFNAPCVEEAHENTYHVFHRGALATNQPPATAAPPPTQLPPATAAPPPTDPPVPTQSPATAAPPPTHPPAKPAQTPAEALPDFPHGLLTCHSGTAAMKSSCDVAGKSREIRNRVIDHYLTLGDSCTVESCPRGDLAGCLVRLVGHDFMDYDPERETGGSDACIDFKDPDNNGLQGCLLHAVNEPDSSNVSLELMWQDYCTEVSAADFFVIVAEGLMEATMPKKWRAHFGAQLERQFRFGRETQAQCDPGLLPNPAEACDAVEKNFIKKLGLNWEEATALMGVHTLGRALPSNSGFDGFWVSGPHATNFSNQYYSNMLGVGWGRKQTIKGKWQWQRADIKNSPEMMLNTDMCLAYATGEAPFTRAEDDTHGRCCLWMRNHSNNRNIMDGVSCDCQGTDPTKGCSSHRNCCRQSMDRACPGFSENAGLSSVQNKRGNTESLLAVSKFAKSQEDWLGVFLPTWEKVTTIGMRDLCA